MSILDDRCRARLTQSEQQVQELQRQLASEKAARQRAEAQLIERNQGGSRYARHA